MSISPSTSFVLPGDDYACGESETKSSGPRLFFSKVQLEWKSSETLYIAEIKLSFKSSSGLAADFTCSINGDALDAMYEFSSAGDFASAKSSNYLNAEHTLLANNSCALKCFGVPISLSAINTSFTVIGTAKVLAYSVDGTGNQKPQSSQTSVSLNYIP